MRQPAQILDRDDHTFRRPPFLLEIAHENTNRGIQVFGRRGAFDRAVERSADVVFHFIGHFESHVIFSREIATALGCSSDDKPLWISARGMRDLNV